MSEIDEIRNMLIGMGFQEHYVEESINAVKPKSFNDLDSCLHWMDEHPLDKNVDKDPNHEVIQTLIGMGFKESRVRKVVKKVPNADIHHCILELLSYRSQRLVLAIAEEEDELKRVKLEPTPGNYDTPTDVVDDVTVPSNEIESPKPNPFSGFDFGLAKIVKKDKKEIDKLTQQIQQLQQQVKMFQSKYENLKQEVDKERKRKRLKRRVRGRRRVSKSPNRPAKSPNRPAKSPNRANKSKVKWESTLRE